MGVTPVYGTSVRRATGFVSPVQIVEEGDQVKSQFTPRLLLTVVEDVGIHDAHRVVHDLRAVGRPMEVPKVGGRGRYELQINI